jgi:hypothetical protein
MLAVSSCAAAAGEAVPHPFVDGALSNANALAVCLLHVCLALGVDPLHASHSFLLILPPGTSTPVLRAVVRAMFERLCAARLFCVSSSDVYAPLTPMQRFVDAAAAHLAGEPSEQLVLVATSSGLTAQLAGCPEHRVPALSTEQFTAMPCSPSVAPSVLPTSPSFLPATEKKRFLSESEEPSEEEQLAAAREAAARGFDWELLSSGVRQQAVAEFAAQAALAADEPDSLPLLLISRQPLDERSAHITERLTETLRAQTGGRRRVGVVVGETVARVAFWGSRVALSPLSENEGCVFTRAMYAARGARAFRPCEAMREKFDNCRTM